MDKILDGKKVAQNILNNLKYKISNFVTKPKLIVILVGDDKASQIYVKNKQIKANQIGIVSEIIKLSKETTEKELLDIIYRLNNQPCVHGILVQLPLPKQINQYKIIESINPIKDVDGFTPENIGKLNIGLEPNCYPCTPLGIIELLKEYNIEIQGKNVVIVGRSNIVGKPLSALFLKNDATVTICHSKTRNLSDITVKAEILVSSVGKANFIESNWVKKGAVIIDVGINKLENGKLSGDVDFKEVYKKCSYITPVPGGIGPMTIAELLKNTYKLYCLQNGI